jgi:RsiW-degrading membrane proteinase PrsW (M82 family)
MSDILLTLIFAFIGGVFPALLWLWFWLKEDKAHPEPNKLIIKTFIFGILMVPVAFVFQSVINLVFLDGSGNELIEKGGVLAIIMIFVWAGTEELVKYIAAKKGGLDNKSNDEPLDVPIYLITAALGFAALENVLFIISPLLEGNLAEAFLTGNMRFIGATLLHVASSAIIGLFGAFSYFFKKEIKKLYIFGGFIVSVLLHAVFNLFIISNNDIAYMGFITVWLFIVTIVILFEKIKKIKVMKI